MLYEEKVIYESPLHNLKLSIIELVFLKVYKDSATEDLI